MVHPSEACSDFLNCCAGPPTFLAPTVSSNIGYVKTSKRSKTGRLMTGLVIGMRFSDFSPWGASEAEQDIQPAGELWTAVPVMPPSRLLNGCRIAFVTTRTSAAGAAYAMIEIFCEHLGSADAASYLLRV